MWLFGQSSHSGIWGSRFLRFEVPRGWNQSWLILRLLIEIPIFDSFTVFSVSTVVCVILFNSFCYFSPFVMICTNQYLSSPIFYPIFSPPLMVSVLTLISILFYTKGTIQTTPFLWIMFSILGSVYSLCIHQFYFYFIWLVPFSHFHLHYVLIPAQYFRYIHFHLHSSWNCYITCQ